jgi:hypothetical protein
MLGSDEKEAVVIEMENKKDKGKGIFGVEL